MRRWFFLSLLTAALLLLVGRVATQWYVDHAWFASLSAERVFWEEFTDRLLLQGGSWIAGSLFAFANLHAVRRTIAAVAMQSRVANIELTSVVPSQRLTFVTVVVSLIIGLFLALPMTNWADLALARHGVPFGEIEGITGRDLGFYVYWVPFEETLYLWALLTVVTLTAMVLVLYALTRSLRIENRHITSSTHVRRHLSVLGGIVLLLLAWSYRLDAFDLLLAGSGPGGQFVHVDHRITMRIDTWLSVLCALGAFAVVRFGWLGQLRTTFTTLSIVLVLAIVMRHLVPGFVARTDWIGNVTTRDDDYRTSRAIYSRRAFNVQAIRALKLSGSPTGGLTAQADSTARLTGALTGSAITIPVSQIDRTVGLWSRRALADALTQSVAAQLQPSIRGRDGSSVRTAMSDADAVGSGGFAPAASDINIGWDARGGQMSAFVAMRTPGAKDSWRFSQVDITRPQVREQSISRSEFRQDGPDGSWPLVAPGKTGVRVFDGVAFPGVPAAWLTSTTSRVAHAWALRDVSFLSAEEHGIATPVLSTHLDPRERLALLAPVFVQGSEVVPIHADGRLTWALELYSASDRYPLSQPREMGEGVYSYFRHAATALVDAATGQVKLLPDQAPDPIARTWFAMLPSLMASPADLSDDLLSQLPTASDGVLLQLRTLERYGSRLPELEGLNMPEDALLGGLGAPLIMSYGSHESLPVWNLPLIDGDGRLGGLLLVAGGRVQQTFAVSFGEPSLHWRPGRKEMSDALFAFAATGEAEPGTGHVSVSDSSSGVGLSNGAVSTRIMDSLRTEALFTDVGILAFQTLRRERNDGSVGVAGVAAYDGTRIGVGASLADALDQIGVSVPHLARGASPLLAGGSQGSNPDDKSITVNREASRVYEAMRRALQRGDWVSFGAAMDTLGLLLRRPPG